MRAVAELDPLSLEDLEEAAEQFAAMVDRGLHDVIEQVMDEAGLSDEDIESLSPADVDQIVSLWEAFVVGTLLPFLVSGMAEAQSETADALTRALDSGLPGLNEPLDTQRYLERARNRLVGIGDELWFNARRGIAEGLSEGESIPKIAARVREAVDVASPRAQTIARTESHGARNAVNHMTVRRVDAAFRVSGAIRRRWQAANDERTRETHRRADGQVVELNEPFRVGRASLEFPGDPSGPADEVINCRCTSITLIDTEALGAEDTSTEVVLNASATDHEYATRTYQEDDIMPWSVVEGDERCDSGEYAVVKDDDNELEGCHATREEAEDQVTALNIAEAEEGEDVGASDVSSSVSSMSTRNTVPWSGVIVVEGTPTADGRQFAPNSLTWPSLGSTESLEIPLGWKYERAHGGVDTDKVVTVGRIDSITRQGNELHATGLIDLDSARGPEVARMMGTRDNPGFLAGVSIDADNPEDPRGLEVEYVFPESCALNEDGSPVVDEDSMDMSCMVPEMEIYHSGRIRAATLVDIPAYVEARIYLDEDTPEQSEQPEPVAADVDMPVIASASYTLTIPDLPPVSWFEEPKNEPDIGAITVTDDGRVYGYLAPKHVAHRGIRDKRVEVPTGNVDYGIWMNRVTLAETSDGSFTRVATGPITMDCGHASASSRVRGAARREHYDNSCSIVATVRAGENARGVWIAGALLPDVQPEQIRRMMACQLSGDWGPHREKPGKRELAAAHLVPVPGFPKRTYSHVSVSDGYLNRVSVPVRFGVRFDAPAMETFGVKAAADKIAASIGRDRTSRIHEFREHLQELLGRN